METYEPEPGENIAKTCKVMAAIATAQDESISAKFNRITIVAEPGVTAEELEQGYWDESKIRPTRKEPPC